ncbi:MAG: SPASM domain-containing protein [Candidatus Accumulibacter sp.]|nr:SPASM domain-containing protein [Accumulibacter sp.]
MDAPEAGKPPVLSAEIFVIPLEANRFLVYAPLRRAAFVGNAGVVNLLADLREGRTEGVKEGADSGDEALEFLRRLEIVDAGPETPPHETFADEPEPTSVTLFLTTACNLRCTYCYAAAGEGEARHMPPELARRGVDFVVGNAVRRGEDHFEVNFHGGGEPARNWPTLTETLAYARRQAEAHGLNLTAYIATNAVFSKMQLDWVVANLDGASVSCDGLPEVHDANRVTPGGKGSSASVLHTLRRFDAENFSYGIRMTVTAAAIPRLADSVEFLCANFHPGQIQAEPAYQIGRGAVAPSAETEAFVSAFREAQARARGHGQELTFSAARAGTLTRHFCAATQDLFAITPSGSVSSCYEVFDESSPRAPIFLYGAHDGEGGWRFDQEKIAFLRSQSVDRRAWCAGCFARWSCGGDCYHKALAVHGGGEFAGTERCDIIRALTKDQILTRIAEAGGVFWHEAPTDAVAVIEGCDCVSCGE